VKPSVRSLYAAEQIINWRFERLNGRNVPTLVVLSEMSSAASSCWRAGPGPVEPVSRYRKSSPTLVPGRSEPRMRAPRGYHCPGWKSGEKNSSRRGSRLARESWNGSWSRRLLPLRLGKPLPLIPFVFHGPRHSRPECGPASVDGHPRGEPGRITAWDADFKHGLHYTALPTAWVMWFRQGRFVEDWLKHRPWHTESLGATAGFSSSPGKASRRSSGQWTAMSG